MKVVLLAGGVGGAKMAEGLAAAVGRDLTVIVNTGDDLELHGLAVWPDHDTVAYTLAGLDDEIRGWGIRGENRPSWIGSRLSARRSGSASATGISLRTCGGPIDSGPVTVLRRWRSSCCRDGHRVADPADDRRSGPHRGSHRRRLARVPGVLRASPPGADRA